MNPQDRAKHALRMLPFTEKAKEPFVTTVEIEITKVVAAANEERYEWASIINRLACLALDGCNSNDRDYAQDMIEMVNPYLGLAGE